MPFLRLFGYPTLELDEQEPIPNRATQRHRLALLALLGATQQGWSRDKLVCLLWPESPTERARSSLSESIYVLRRALGEDAIVSVGDELRLSTESVRCDVREFESAIDGDDLPKVVALYRGPFLDGFFVPRAPELERWAEGERVRLAGMYASALERLAAKSTRSGDAERAVDWWRKRAALDPYDARIAAALMEALVAAGDRAGALSHARLHGTLVREEYGIETDDRVLSLERALRMSGTLISSTPAAPNTLTSDVGGVPAVDGRAAHETWALTTKRRVSRRVVRIAGAFTTVMLIAGAAYSSQVLQRRSAVVSPLASPNVARSNRQAYEYYARGRSQLAHHREPDTRSAVANFEQAIARDSGFALGHAGLAIASAEMHLRFASAAEAPRWGELAVRAARRALELDSTLAEVHEALAAVYRKSEFDWDGTISESRQALALNPRAPMPHFYIGGAFFHLGILERAERAVRAGLELDDVPDRAEALRTLGTVALAAGRYGEAVSLFQSVQRLSDRPVSDPNLAAAYYYSGDTAQATQLLEALVMSPSTSAASRARALLAGIEATHGNRPRAEELLARAATGQVDHHVAYSIGVAHAILGRPQEGIRWLRVAAETGFRCYPWYARDPMLAPLRADAEFRALLRELRIQHGRDTDRYRDIE